MKEADSNVRLIFLATLFFGVLSLFSFLWVNRIEQPSDALISQLHVGKHLYDLRSEQKCVGGMEFELREDPSPVLVVKGTLRTMLLGRLIALKFFVGAFFNSLNQLVSANVQIDTEGQGLSVVLSQPNPVHVRINLTRKEQTMKLRELDIAGPIEMIRNFDRTYRLSYVRLGANIQRMVQQFSKIRPLPQSRTESPLRFVDGVGDGFCGQGESEAATQVLILDSLLKQYPVFGDGAWAAALASKFIGKSSI